jgi:diaminohydroxyphosphoribosylaminopyrimidine deaminase/5-amino-6-(5-phosphoribosylamino)uracil reductase
MAAALNLARRGLGRVAPNPAVGCVLVKAGRVIGRGWTGDGGRPHAETIALAQAGTEAHGADAYVGLEPCAHHGKTPPCAEALIAAGIARCAVALEDPDPRVAGRGIAWMRNQGIEVTSGLLADDAAHLNEGYLFNRLKKRPLVTVKLASTLDGRIAMASGESRWITNELSRTRVHLLRAEHDAVMVGSSTAIADNPKLDVRIPGLEAQSPMRVVPDSRLRLPLTHDLVARARVQRTLLATSASSDRQRLRAYRDAGVEIVELTADESGQVAMTELLAHLAEGGVTRLLVEGGGHLIGSLLRDDLVDRLKVFGAPRIIGADGVPSVASLGIHHLAQAPGFELTGQEILGMDSLSEYRRAGGG